MLLKVGGGGEERVIWIYSANVLFLSIILKVLLGPLEICVIQFSVCMVKSIRLSSMNVDACMAPNILLEVNVIWQISKCDD